MAGIELRKAGESYQPIFKEGKPKWLRPISKFQHGAVSEALIGGLKLMDVIELEIEEFCPDGYQSENATFKDESVKKIGKINLAEKNLDVLTDREQDY